MLNYVLKIKNLGDKMILINSHFKRRTKNLKLKLFKLNYRKTLTNSDSLDFSHL
jgi:urease beta subunit